MYGDPFSQFKEALYTLESFVDSCGSSETDKEKLRATLSTVNQMEGLLSSVPMADEQKDRCRYLQSRIKAML